MIIHSRVFTRGQKVNQSSVVVIQNSSAECKKVVSDIFGEIVFLMEYEIYVYSHILHYFQTS